MTLANGDGSVVVVNLTWPPVRGKLVLPLESDNSVPSANAKETVPGAAASKPTTLAVSVTAEPQVELLVEVASVVLLAARTFTASELLVAPA